MRVFILIFLIFTFVFPKAGTKFGEFPFYVSVILSFVIAFRIFYKKIIEQFRRFDISFLCYLLLFSYVTFDLFISMFLNYNLSTHKLILFLSAFVSVFYLVFMYFQQTFNLHISYWIKILTFAFWFLSIYGLIQKICGDYTVVIPGLTAAYSEAIKPNFLASKDNMIWGLNYLKLSSTYQNGNLFGLNYILISWFYFYFLDSSKREKLLLLSLLVYTLICLLTASATVIVGCFFSLFLFISLKSRLKLQYVFFSTLILLTLFLVLSLLLIKFPILLDILKYRLYERNFYQMGGRIPTLLSYLGNLDFRSFLFGGSLSSINGGAYEITLLAVFYFFGIFGVAFFLLLFLFILREISFQRIYTIGILSYILMSFSDGAFWLPPTAVNFSMLLSLALFLSKRTKLQGLRYAIND